VRTIKWQGYEWITQERWGQVHPEKSHWWYDESCVSIDEKDNLHLKTKSNPKYFPELDVISNIGTGLVSCTEKFGYGVFSIDAKLPKGKHLWPAFWMWSWDSWPPEIDIFEGYSNGFGISKPMFTIQMKLVTKWLVVKQVIWDSKIQQNTLLPTAVYGNPILLDFIIMVN